MNVNIKLAIREDRKAGVIRAYFGELDDRGERIEMATLDLALANKVPGLFDRWREMLSDALGSVIEQTTGMKFTGFVTFRSHEKN